MKAAIFHAAALRTLRTFPREIRLAFGESILDLQNGAILGMPISRPMPTVAPGVQELRVHDRSGHYRALYLVRSSQGVLIFHVFSKKTAKTPNHEIQIGRKRLKEMLNENN